MARWETVKCTRCKKEVQMKDTNLTGSLSLSTKQVFMNGSVDTTGIAYDLCQECVGEFKVWMKG